MSDFQPSAYGPVFAELIDRDRLRSLGAGTPATVGAATLEGASLDALFGHTQIVDDSMARCCQSAVWLLCDFLDESHTISQGISTASGSFWHGIMHRREGDFSNAKYWFRNVGDHPAYQRIAEAAGIDCWDPFDFVDACQQAVRTGGADAERCRGLQQMEWEVLFDYCYQAAVKPQWPNPNDQ